PHVVSLRLFRKRGDSPAVSEIHLALSFFGFCVTFYKKVTMTNKASSTCSISKPIYPPVW
ncbi:MAG: hypothetical protein V4616_11555, partial [Bacteroidota bacterium]